MDLGLKRRRALVTGSTAGIGLAVAIGLAREGADVIVNGRTRQRVDSARDQILAAVPSARVERVVADLSTAAGNAEVIRAFPDVDILVNNVGVFAPTAFEDIPDEDWMRFFETNVMSGVRLSRAYFPGMLRRDWGRIVFVSSESAVQIPSEMIHYGVTKTAQLALARGLAERTVGTGVTVNSVLPGPTLSEGVGVFVSDLARAHGTDPETAEREFFVKMRPSSLLQRFASPDEVANLVVYVASQAASATNGAALRVDGGVIRSIL